MKEQEQQQPKPSLGDTVVVYSLCFQFVELLLETQNRVMDGRCSVEQAAQNDTDVIDYFSYVLSGQSADVLPAAGWSGAPLGRYLRQRFAPELIALEDCDRDCFEDDASVIVFAVCEFGRQAHALLRAMAQDRGEESRTEAEARRVHDLCVHWTEIFTNRPFVGNDSP